MQLGTRWAAGSEPPASVPAALRPGIAEVEARLAADGSPGPATPDGSLSPATPDGSPSPATPDGSLSLSKGSRPHWTLTWLEGRPIAELDAGWEVLQTASGEVVARPFED